MVVIKETSVQIDVENLEDIKPGMICIVGAGKNMNSEFLRAANERGITIVVADKLNFLPETVPQGIINNKMKQLEIELTSMDQYRYHDYKDGKQSRREKRAIKRKNK